MTGPTEARADTRIMEVVHSALRRDLARAHDLLSAEAALRPRQRVAVGAHLVWLMELLAEHLRGEDRELWPRVRARMPDAAASLGPSEGDLRAMPSLMKAVEQAAVEFSRGASAGPVVDALDRLEGTLLPYLRREEIELMPLVTATLTEQDWAAFVREQFVQGRSLLRLGMVEGWLVDGLSASDAALVDRLVPDFPRSVLVRGLACRYRRLARRRWGARPSGFGIDGAGGFPLATHGTVSVEVAATPPQVWAVLADPTRVGEWSHEAVGARWLDGAHDAVPGARFEGRSRAGVFRWRRPCLITTVEPDRRIAWRTRGGVGRDSTEWSFALEPSAGGTRIIQSFEVLTCARWWAVLISLAVPPHRDRTTSLVEDLAALGEVAAVHDLGPATTSPPQPEMVSGSSRRTGVATSRPVEKPGKPS